MLTLSRTADPAQDAEFIRLAEPFRHELLVHCYRMLGSLHDAEDLVQETYLRAWRGYDRFEGRSSLRVWLYRIATSACLTALDHRSRRVLPSGLGAPGADPQGPPAPETADILWLQPLPTPPGGGAPTGDPASIVAARDSVRLAFIAALQHLPARQRAVLILRDVLAWRAAEVADLLGTTTVSVNSALRRARARLDKAAPREDDVAEPSDPDRLKQLDRYMEAFEHADLDALLGLLRDDAVLEMPPIPTWFAGREAVIRFLAANVFVEREPFRMLPITANGGPAVAAYTRDADGVFRAHAIQILAFRGSGVSRITSFNDPALFASFGLSERLN